MCGVSLYVSVCVYVVAFQGTFFVFFFPFSSEISLSLAPELAFLPPIFFLSTILGATVTYQCDHLSAIRALQHHFNVHAIGIGKAEPEHVQVVLRVFRYAETRAFYFNFNFFFFVGCGVTV